MKLTQTEERMAGLSTEKEKMYQEKISGLMEAVRAGNELFDFFSDIYINASNGSDVDDELLCLEAYLMQVYQTPCAPRSFAMTCYKEDDIIAKALRGEYD